MIPTSTEASIYQAHSLVFPGHNVSFLPEEEAGNISAFVPHESTNISIPVDQK